MFQKVRVECCQLSRKQEQIAQVAKANGEHKKNVWEIMQCPEFVLKYNKSVHRFHMLPIPMLPQVEHLTWGTQEITI